jgi:putative phage-type endonuclease
MIPQQQGSAEWLEWRKDKIGASEAAACMGISPWQTPYELWYDKTCESSTRYVNVAMARGSAMEEAARMVYENVTGETVFPKVVVHPKHPWAIASLDGMTLDDKLFVEIKCPNAETHEMASHGHITPYYMAQLQHQLWVTGLPVCHYFSYDGVTHHLIQVEKDEDFINRMIYHECQMLRCIEMKTPPLLQEKDKAKAANTEAKQEEVDLSQDAAWLGWENSYVYFKRMADEAESGMKAAKEQLEKLSEGKNVKGSCVKYTRITRPGAVDYAKVPELLGVDLDQYRKEPVVSIRITIDKE